MGEIGKVYKPLVETPDGKLVSVWAGVITGVTLEYKKGKVTYTPEGGAGIWVNESLEDALYQEGSKNKKGVFVVYEAIALGERCGDFWLTDGRLSSFSSDPRYPAVLLGKEVWRKDVGTMEPVRPEPKFKVGDTVAVVGGIYEGQVFEITGVAWGEDDDFPGHKHYHYSSEKNKYPIDEDYLELAPEWVDVTRECTFAPFGNKLFGGEYHILVDILHNGKRIGFLGLNQLEPGTDNEYKIERDADTGRGTQWFRVFKREY